MKRLSSAALVHIAAHSCIETGEIALAPNPTLAAQIPFMEDFLLTMGDVFERSTARKTGRAKLPLQWSWGYQGGRCGWHCTRFPGFWC